jgi:glutamyl-tRNA reductase
MAILAYGLNFRTAPIDLRERIAFPEEGLDAALKDLLHAVPGVEEAAILSTCNRTEVYCAAQLKDHAPLAEWLAVYRKLSVADIVDATYAHWDHDAARHLMRVASGLDSQVLGEPQILGQFKDAVDVARAAGTLGPELNLLSQLSLNVAKRVRTETDIGKNPVSIAYVAVSLATQIFSDLSRNQALLLGAGDTMELAALHLREAGIGSIAIANRTLANAQEIANKVNGRALLLTDIAHDLHRFDIVIAATGSPIPVLGKGAVEAAIKARKHRPMLMVDIAVPRDIEPEVSELSDVYLYSIDDLTDIIDTHLKSRRRAAESAEAMIVEGADRFFRERRIREAQHLLKSFRERAESLQAQELERARQRLSKGAFADDVLQELARALTNKLIHDPTVAIREASADGRHDLLELIRRLYGIEHEG